MLRRVLIKCWHLIAVIAATDQIIYIIYIMHFRVVLSIKIVIKSYRY